MKPAVIFDQDGTLWDARRVIYDTWKATFDRHPEIKNHSFWRGKLWSPSYYVGTLGNMSKETVRKYIQNQYAKD